MWKMLGWSYQSWEMCLLILLHHDDRSGRRSFKVCLIFGQADGDSCSASPHTWSFTWAKWRTCKVTAKPLPQPLWLHTQSFGTLGQLLKIHPFALCPPKNRITRHNKWIKMMEVPLKMQPGYTYSKHRWWLEFRGARDYSGEISCRGGLTF